MSNYLQEPLTRFLLKLKSSLDSANWVRYDSADISEEKVNYYII